MFSLRWNSVIIVKYLQQFNFSQIEFKNQNLRLEPNGLSCFHYLVYRTNPVKLKIFLKL